MHLWNETIKGFLAFHSSHIHMIIHIIYCNSMPIRPTDRVRCLEDIIRLLDNG